MKHGEDKTKNSIDDQNKVYFKYIADFQFKILICGIRVTILQELFFKRL